MKYIRLIRLTPSLPTHELDVTQKVLIISVFLKTGLINCHTAKKDRTRDFFSCVIRPAALVRLSNETSLQTTDAVINIPTASIDRNCAIPRAQKCT